MKRDWVMFRKTILLKTMATASFMTLVLCGICQAEPARRFLELELEEVEGGTGYEIQVTRILDAKTKKPPIFFKIKSSKWSATLVPGKYELAIRSIDSRGVPGDWGPPQEFLVKLAPPRLTEPGSDKVVKSDDDQKDKVDFHWSPVEGATKYKFKISENGGEVIQESIVEKNEITAKIPVAKKYSWEVTPYMDELEGEKAEPNKFELHGTKLDVPRVRTVEDFNTNKIEWSNIKYASAYDFVLSYKEKYGRWRVVDRHSLKTPQRSFRRSLPSGTYQVKVAATGSLREDSEFSIREFKTQKIDRSVAAIEQIKSEGSYEPKSGLIALASYYIAMVNYNGTNNNYNTVATYPAVGGTGRLGLGTWFKDDSPWGGILNVDISGFTIGSQTFKYLAGSLQAIYRNRLGVLGQLRVNMGAQYRELPETIGDPSGNNSYTQATISTLGPLVGVSLAHAFTRKLGLQGNAQVAESLFGVSTPTGAANVAQLSYQYGLLGSMSLTDKLVGFVGYAYRSESAAYAFTPGLSNGATQGPNSVTLSGQYINLMLEYGF